MNQPPALVLVLVLALVLALVLVLALCRVPRMMRVCIGVHCWCERPGVDGPCVNAGVQLPVPCGKALAGAPQD